MRFSFLATAISAVTLSAGLSTAQAQTTAATPIYTTSAAMMPPQQALRTAPSAQTVVPLPAQPLVLSAAPTSESLVIAETAKRATTNSRIEVGLHAGMMWGEAQEFVLDPTKAEGAGNRVSQLNWDYAEVPMIGVSAKFYISKNFAIRGEYWTKAGGANGYMEDYDWIDPLAATPSPGLTPYADNAWTDKSWHDNAPVKKAENIDVSLAFSPNAGYHVTAMGQTGTVKLSGIIGARRDEYKMTSIDGNYIYSDVAFRDDSGTLTSGAEVIDYEQKFQALYLGLGADLTFDRWDISGEAFYGRYDATAVDNHYARTPPIRFYDAFDNGNMYGGHLAASYHLAPIGPFAKPAIKGSVDLINYSYARGRSANGTAPSYTAGPADENSAATSFIGTTLSLGLVTKF